MPRLGRVHRSTIAAVTGVAAAAALTVGASPATGAAADQAADGGAARHGWHGRHAGRTVEVQLLAINDFHGNLEPPGGSGGLVSVPGSSTGVKAGGAAYLATALKDLRAKAAARGERSLTVAAGDLIGASPLVSAAFHDEPTIEAMNLMGLQVASVGNHEFDEGYRELQRMQRGGCLDDGADGANNQNSCPDESRPFMGADFHYLAANVLEKATGRTILPSTWVTRVGRERIGFIGMTLEGTPDIVSKAGIQGLEFRDEVQTADRVAKRLQRRGVKSIVVLLHEGGFPADPAQYNACPGISGPIVDIAHNLSPKIDAVISGHTHQAYNCRIPGPTGKERLVTSASSFGRLVTEVTLSINRRSGNVVQARSDAQNHIVTQTVPQDAAVASLVETYKTLVAPIAAKPIGHIAGGAELVSRTPDDSLESPLGNLIADAQRADPTVDDVRPVDVAFMNPGGIRADLVTPGGQVTYGNAFTVQPFNNFVVSMDMTGPQIEALLEQQFSGKNAGTRPDGTSNSKVLQVSAGFHYEWSRSGAPGDKVDPASISVNGQPLDMTGGTTYRVVANSFLSDGGDNFAAFTQASNKLVGGLDIDAFAAYLGANDPYTPVPTDRIDVTP